MTKITDHEDFTLAGSKRIEADIAAGRRDAGMDPLSVEEAQAAKDLAFAAMDANRNSATIYDAEIARLALSRALDDHERATRTGRFAPVDMNPLSEAP